MIYKFAWLQYFQRLHGYWKMARLSGDFLFWKHEALLGIGILEGHGVVENGDSLYLQAMHCG
jgi:hypothetical protein